jgi:hypothetical protein
MAHSPMAQLPMAQPPAPHSDRPLDPLQDGERVRVEEVLDLEALTERLGRPPTPRQLREALPVGLVLDEDGVHVRRDLRMLARHGWVLVAGLVSFGTAGLWLFQETFPRGWRGVGRFAVLIGIVALAGGVVGPMITRALMRGTGPRRPRG